GVGLLALARTGSFVPPGFVVIVDGFEALLAAPDLRRGIAEVLGKLDPFDPAGMENSSSEIRRLVCGSPMPFPVAEAVADAYGTLCAGAGHDVPVAVRSSATAEDLPDASFAGQHDTLLWVIGTRAVLDAVQRCWSSLWTARALGYRAAQGVPEAGAAMAVIVQQMVDARTAGVAMTVNPSDGDPSKIVIEACWGLGEPLLSGEMNPDHYVVDKVLLSPVRTRVAAKPRELVAAPDKRSLLRRPIDGDRLYAPCLNPDEVVKIARLAKEAERQYGRPLEIEWAVARDSAASESLQVLQCRAETVWSKRSQRSPVVPPESGAAGIANTLLGL
ncbi:PEP/pyruvate-binding domain-containing protein, partial [Streptomyces neyagawaensis]|uniref:PEP/pyruvate-binding domain-containing protein n=1 Tax=Streptomyces neyagawaensis TaxID=42238 RepID=UPI0006E1F005